jgi:hypothetical protein
MSSFLNRGKRIEARKKKKEVKHHTKEFYKILHELDSVAEEMLKDEELVKQLTEDNVIDLARPYTKLELGNLEKMVLLGKLGMYQAMENQIEDGKDNNK